MRTSQARERLLAAAVDHARLGVAVVRGLLLDLLATAATRAGVTEAYERFLARGPATPAPTAGHG